MPGTRIFYSIQGNILANEDVVTAAMATFAETKGTLADRVMAAMETSDARGGDRRCTCETKPFPAATAACENKTSHVAYILRADAADKPGASFNDGQYAMYVAVTNDDITAAENPNGRTVAQIPVAWAMELLLFDRLLNERAVASGKPALIELKIDPDAITPATTLSAIRERARKARLT